MITIKTYKKLTAQKWLNLFEVKYVAKNGHEKSWQLASRKEKPKCIIGNYETPDAVVIVPFHKDEGKMVVTKEYRVPLKDYEYGFPAGLVDKGESVQEAARRELMEETGLSVSRFLKIGPALYSSAGMTDESVAMVYVECEGKTSIRANTGTEIIKIMLISQTDAAQLCNDSKLKFDAKAWLVLSHFAEHGHI
jgi:ADP-ribose pyrophosphatase